MEHWLVSIHCHSSESAQIWGNLKSEILTPNVATSTIFNIDQQFKSGSLDSLVALADELGKLDHQLEGTLRKIERQYVDIDPNPQLVIGINNRGAQEYLSPSAYLSDFHWDISRYQPSKTLQELVGLIEERLRNLDDDVKAKTSKFIEARNTLSQITKKESGSLLNKDLSEIFTPEVVSEGDFINTEYLKTLLVIIPKKEIPNWLNSYERLSERVVPQSTKQFNIEDKDGLTL